MTAEEVRVSAAGDLREEAMVERSVYDMSDEEYDRLEQNALVHWRAAYPKTAKEADNESAAAYCTDNYSASDMAEAYTDGYRTGYLCAKDAESASDKASPTGVPSRRPHPPPTRRDGSDG